jgi:hypothetical protein
MSDTHVVRLIDYTLTPSNAFERGYAFFDDILYDAQSSSASLQEVLQLMRGYGYKLGAPKSQKDISFFCGL